MLRGELGSLAVCEGKGKKTPADPAKKEKKGSVNDSGVGAERNTEGLGSSIGSISVLKRFGSVFGS